jgi:hypothetical protein
MHIHIYMHVFMRMYMNIIYFYIYLFILTYTYSIRCEFQSHVLNFQPHRYDNLGSVSARLLLINVEH